MDRERLKYVDVLKGFAILSVVLAHAIEGYIESSVIRGGYESVCIIIYNLTYAFHMPLLILLSGITFRVAYVFLTEKEWYIRNHGSYAS